MSLISPLSLAETAAAGAGSAAVADALRETATGVRLSILRMIGRAGLGHVGGDLSVADILTTLYFGVMHIRPEEPRWPGRDRCILSKGHCAAALYSVLALRGFFPKSDLEQFMRPLSPLNGHPNRNKVPGVEANTGPLGHGLPIGVGSAVASGLSGSGWRTFVVLGDGELQEGSNWEAAMAAGHRKLSNLTAIIDRNRLQQGAGTEATNALEPLAAKWQAFGWDTVEVDGHDHAVLLETLSTAPGDRPRCVIANTRKGKGVSFMEDRVEWHHKVPNAEQLQQALAELGA